MNNQQSSPFLINCPACSAQVSNQAISCPTCGQPINASNYSSTPHPAKAERETSALNTCTVCKQPIAPPAVTCPSCAQWLLTGRFPDHHEKDLKNTSTNSYQLPSSLAIPKFQHSMGDLPASGAHPTNGRTGVLLAIGIFIMPYIFSWFTLRKGYSNLTRIVSFI